MPSLRLSISSKGAVKKMQRQANGTNMAFSLDSSSYQKDKGFQQYFFGSGKISGYAE